MTVSDRLQRKIRELPNTPGCYLMRDRKGSVIYVGKAACLRKRVQSYFRDAALRRGSPKLRGLVNSIHDIEIVSVRSEAEALLTEGRLIKEFRPRYNVSFRDDKRFLLLKADVGQPFPRLRLCRIRKDDGAVYFGPYASSHSTRAALDFVEKRYGLRKCAPRVPDHETYRHCINDIVRYCSAPCTGKVSRQEYRDSFAEACAFLRGERPKVLSDLRQAMSEAAEGLEFERAGALRDTLFALQSTVRQKTRVTSTPEMKKREALAGLQELKQVLNLPRLPRTIECYDISNISGTYAVAGMVCAVDGLPRRNRYRRFRIRTVTGSDDPAMMAETIRRRFGRLAEEGAEPPRLVLVDGGITQLRAALFELQAAGFSGVPVAGLAKRLEEIYRPDRASPVRLPADSRGLQVLQRLRDEAHRFALTYHRHLRSLRIRESALDAVPGIGPGRKQKLLEHFGSVRRMERASREQIAAVPGIGPSMAGLVHEALGRKQRKAASCNG